MEVNTPLEDRHVDTIKQLVLPAIKQDFERLVRSRLFQQGATSRLGQLPFPETTMRAIPF